MRENPGDFRKVNKMLTFLSPTLHVPYLSQNIVLHNDLNNEFGLKYWTSNPGSNFRNVEAPFTWILKKKYDYWWKKYWLTKTDRANKTLYGGWNRAISVKPGKNSHPGLVSPGGGPSRIKSRMSRIYIKKR